MQVNFQPISQQVTVQYNLPQTYKFETKIKVHNCDQVPYCEVRHHFQLSFTKQLFLLSNRDVLNSLPTHLRMIRKSCASSSDQRGWMFTLKSFKTIISAARLLVEI